MRRRSAVYFIFVFLCRSLSCLLVLFFFFNDTATTEIYTLSLHDALPICTAFVAAPFRRLSATHQSASARGAEDRKSTRLNSSHEWISYAVFCLKKKKTKKTNSTHEQKQNKRKKTS